MRTCLLVPLLVVGACSWNAAGSTGCEPVGGAVRLPEALRESSGVAFSRHPVTEDSNSMVIEAVFGNNELLVQGAVTPDCYVVNKFLFLF